MHMLGQYHPGIDMKRMSRPYRAHRLAQEIDLADQQIAAAVTQIDGEEVSGAGNAGTSVVGHGGSSLSVGCMKQGGQTERWLHAPVHPTYDRRRVGWMTLCSSTVAVVCPQLLASCRCSF